MLRQAKMCKMYKNLLVFEGFGDSKASKKMSKIDIFQTSISRPLLGGFKARFGGSTWPRVAKKWVAKSSPKNEEKMVVRNDGRGKLGRRGGPGLETLKVGTWQLYRGSWTADEKSLGSHLRR